MSALSSLLAAVSSTVALALGAAIFSPSTEPPAETPEAPETPATTTTPAAIDALIESADTVTAEQATAWLLDYTGGEAQRARGRPVWIGFATDEVGFPGWTDGVEAGVRYLNAELGGIRGRPVELVTCPVRLAGEAAACAAAFATDPRLSLVITGALASGGTRFLNRLAGSHAVLIGSATTIGDLTSPSAVSFTPGTTGLAAGAVDFAVRDLDAASLAVIVSDDDQGEAAAQVTQSQLATHDVAAAIVYLPLGADVAAATVALHAAGALRADATVLIVPPALCRSVHDAAAGLEVANAVITTDACADEAGAEPGWYGVGSGYSPHLADLPSGMAAAVHVWTSDQATTDAGTHAGTDAGTDDGPTSTDSEDSEGSASARLPTTTNVSGAAAILTAARVLNGLGDDPDYDVVDGALRSFGGAVMAQPGPVVCGVPPFVAVCVHVVGIGRFDDDGWEPVRSALLDNPIEVEIDP